MECILENDLITSGHFFRVASAVQQSTQVGLLNITDSEWNPE